MVNRDWQKAVLTRDSTIKDAIINSYRSYKVNDRSKLLTYFIENKLKSLMENISDF